MSEGILLIGHGSRQAAGNAQFLRMAAGLAARQAPKGPTPWAACFLDHAQPDIPAGIARLVEQGCTQISVMPVFLFAAGHAKRDVPAHLEAARGRYPQITFGYGSPLGVDPGLVRVCAQTVLAERTPPAETAVLLVGRGSSAPEANDGLLQVARLLQAQTGVAAVHPAYCDVAAPTVPEGMAACVATGARRILLLPYFLFRGVLMDRMAGVVSTWQERHPDRDFRLVGADGLAAWPEVADLIWQRATKQAPGA